MAAQLRTACTVWIVRRDGWRSKPGEEIKLDEVPAERTARKIFVQSSKVTGFRSQLDPDGCHFTPEEALAAYDEDLVRSIAYHRHALTQAEDDRQQIARLMHQLDIDNGRVAPDDPRD